MSINFTNNIEQYTSINRAVKAKQFQEFGSKKQLQDADVLTDKELRFVTSIKGTFGFALHNDGRYMAVTLYRVVGEERKYNFLVLDLKEQAVAEVGSIKEAKAAILELIEEAQAPAEEGEPVEDAPVEGTSAEESADPVQELLDEVLGQQEAEEGGKKSKKTKTA